MSRRYIATLFDWTPECARLQALRDAATDSLGDATDEWGSFIPISQRCLDANLYGIKNCSDADRAVRSPHSPVARARPPNRFGPFQSAFPAAVPQALDEAPSPPPHIPHLPPLLPRASRFRQIVVAFALLGVLGLLFLDALLRVCAGICRATVEDKQARLAFACLTYLALS